MRRWIAVVLLISLLLPGAFAAAQGGEDLELESFTSDLFYLQGVKPVDWDEVSPGAFARAESAADLTSLIAQSAPGATGADIGQALLPSLGLAELPEAAGTMETASFTWTVYEIVVAAGFGDVAVDLALTEDDSRAYTVILQTYADERDAYYESVFLPAVEALAPYAPVAEEMPYTTEEVSFSHDDATLAGTLSLPEGDGPFPAVVLISGSGSQDRDGSLEPVAAIKPFRLIADALTEAGIAVLRYDDRGIGGSSGDAATATSADLALDAEAGLDFLLNHPVIDPEQIGLLGHSEGGMIAPMIAAQRDDVAFVIAMAGPGVNGAELLLLQNELLMSAMGMSDAEIETQLEGVQTIIDNTLAEDWDGVEAAIIALVIAQLEALPEEQSAQIEDFQAYAEATAEAELPSYQYWFRFFFAHDPAADWAQVTVPVLALFGGLDLQVDAAQSIPPLEAALEEAGNEDYEIVVFPDANHLFQSAVTGSIEEYGTLAQEFTPDFLPTIIDWLDAHVTLAE